MLTSNFYTLMNTTHARARVRARKENKSNKHDKQKKKKEHRKPPVDFIYLLD